MRRWAALACAAAGCGGAGLESDSPPAPKTSDDITWVDGVLMRAADIAQHASCPSQPAADAHDRHARLVVVHEDEVSQVRFVGGTLALDGEAFAIEAAFGARGPTSAVILERELRPGCHVFEARLDYVPIAHAYSHRFRMRSVRALAVEEAGTVVRFLSTDGAGAVTSPLENRMQIAWDMGPPSPFDAPPVRGRRGRVRDPMPTPAACSHLDVLHLRACAVYSELEVAKRNKDARAIACGEQRTAEVRRWLEVADARAAAENLARIAEKTCHAYPQ